MAKHTSHWRCAKCGQTITINVRVNEPPICHHWGRRALTPTPMERDDD